MTIEVSREDERRARIVVTSNGSVVVSAERVEPMVWQFTIPGVSPSLRVASPLVNASASEAEQQAVQVVNELAALIVAGGAA